MIRSNIGNNKIPYLFLLPFIIIFIVFHLYPLFANMYVSLHSFSESQLYKLENFQYVGFRNFVDIFLYKTIYSTMIPTLAYLLFTCVLLHTCALVLAKCIHMVFKPFQVIFLILLLCPYLTGGFEMTTSYISLRLFGELFMYWANTGLFEILNNVGFYCFVYFVVLERIHPEVREAVLIEGASTAMCFYKIELPALYKVIGILFVLSLVDVIQVSPIVFVLESNGQSSAFNMMFTFLIILLFLFAFIFNKIRK